MASRRVLNVAPVDLRRCPVHGRLVAFDGEGVMLGVCDGCVRDAQRALWRLRGMRDAARARAGAR